MLKKVKIFSIIISIITIISFIIGYRIYADGIWGFSIAGTEIKDVNALNAYIHDNRDNFIEANANDFVNVKLQIGEGVTYSNGQCLFHNKGIFDKNNTYFKITNIIDFDFIDGKFNTIINGTSNDNEELKAAGTELAAAIYYVDHFGEGQYSSASRQTFSTSFGNYKSVADRVDPSIFGVLVDNQSNSSNNWYGAGYLDKVKEMSAAIANYKKVTKENSDSAVKVEVQNPEETVVGPFKISYEGKGIESVTIGGVQGATVQVGDSIYGSWQDVSQIPNNIEFYLRITNADLTKLNGITINFNQESLTYYRSRLVLCRNMTNRGQSLGQFAGIEKQCQGIARYNINDKLVDEQIIVNKEDKNTREKLNVQFKIETNAGSNTWLGRSYNGEYNYNATFENAITFTTPNGRRVIEGLSKDYRYNIWETKTANNNYDIREQGVELKYENGMQVARLNENAWLTINKTVIVNAKNKRKNNGGGNPPTVTNVSQISISGYVWLDKPMKGAELVDGLYKEGTTDAKIGGVTVDLYKDNSKVASTKTSKTGEYRFDGRTYNINANELDRYVVRFDYSSLTIDGKDGKKFISVDFNVKNNNGSLLQNASRAANNDNTDIASLTGRATTQENLRTYMKDIRDGGLYDSSSKELKYINLGIEQTIEPDYQLAEDLKYVKIVMNNHQYVYKYGSKQLPNVAAAPRVSFESPSVNEYQRAVYPSALYDLKNGQNTNGQMKVYVIYEMLITNVTNYQDSRYIDQKLVITDLRNEFDGNRYEYAGSNQAISVEGADKEFIKTENKIKSDFDNWNVNGSTAKYKDSITLRRGEATMKYIQFKVKDSEILRILDNPGEGVRENKPTRVISNGYYQYKMWRYTIYGSRLVTYTVSDITRFDNAPYLKFKLGDERVLKGTAFEDKIDMNGREEGEVIGNGRYDDSSEKPVQGVIVELVAKPTDENAIDRYIGSEDRKNYTIQKAKVTTDSKGYFEITGIMPGEYYLRLTYGDGTQKIMDSNGTIVKIDEYKSTIVVAHAAKAALGNGNVENVKEWYKYMNADNYNIAVDELERRAKHNNVEAQSSMIAFSPLIDITIENVTGNYSGNIVENKETYSGFNFGIIKQPKQELEIHKKIVDTNLAKTSGNNVLSGNPETANKLGLVDLDGIKNQGSLYTRMEVEESSIYGSELKLKYEVEVKNISDKNYYEIDDEHKGWYYKFGEHTNSYSREVKLDVDEVVDCYDQAMLATESDNNYKVIKANISSNGAQDWGTEKRKESVDIQKGKTSEFITDEETKKKFDYKEVLSITKWGTLARKENRIMNVETMKLLAPDENLEFLNISGISETKFNIPNELSNEQKQYAAKSQMYLRPIIYKEPSEVVEAIIVPPTGSNIPLLITIGTISGIAILSLIATGVMFIKKK